jgi:HPt (histidine-containing phosphotransfer) domain-containing protein
MILDDFLADIPLNILAMKAFQESGDLSGVERQAHTIKGVSANVGAERLQSVAFEVEKAAIAQDMTAERNVDQTIERNSSTVIPASRIRSRNVPRFTSLPLCTGIESVTSYPILSIIIWLPFCLLNLHPASLKARTT